MKLEEWLNAKGIRPSDFAITIEVKPAAVSRYLSGDRIPERDTMDRIVAATNGEVTPNDFYGVEADKEPASAGFDGGEVARLAGDRLAEVQPAPEQPRPPAGSHLRVATSRDEP